MTPSQMDFKITYFLKNYVASSFTFLKSELSANLGFNIYK